MTTKSIIDIEVNAAAFQRYQQLFNKYQEQLSKQPGLWKKISGETNANAASFNRMAAAAQAQTRVQRELSDVYRGQTRSLTQGERLWSSIAKHASGIATSIFSATRSLLSWSGIVAAAGGLLGAGGLFGIDRMARTASDQRRSSMGLGMSIGEQKAFQVNFNRAVDPDSFLSWVNQMETDPSKIGPAAGMGVGLTHNTGADAVSLMRAIRARAKANPGMMGMLPSMYHLDGVSGEDVRRLASLSNKEFEGLVTGYGRDVSKLNIKDSTAEAWTDFVKRLDEARGAIFKTLVQGLLRLEKPLEHLSGAFEKFITTLMKSDVVKHAIDKLAGWLDSFSGEIGGDSFLEKVRQFTSDVGLLAEAVHDATMPFRALANGPSAIGAGASDVVGFINSAGARSKFLQNPKTQAYLDRLELLEKTYKLPAGMLSYEAMRESGTDLTGKYNKPNSKGAVGTFGLTPQALKDIYDKANLRIDPTDPLQSALGAAVYDRILMDQFHDAKKALGAYNWGPGNMDAFGRTGQGVRGQSIPQETLNYMSGARVSGSGATTRVEIINNTGGNAAVVVSQLAH